MARVYLQLLYAGRRTWDKIPTNLKEEVKALLIADVSSGVITPERYTELTGEPYNG